MLHELGGLFAAADKTWDEHTVPAEQLSRIVSYLLRRTITGRTAKQLLAMKFGGDPRRVRDIVEQGSLWLVPMTREEYIVLAQGLLDQNDAMARQIREKGQIGKLQWFVGQMMRQGEEGRVEAEKAEAVLKELLGLAEKSD